MKYQTLDGKTFEAATLEELARKLWQSKFMPEETLDEWMAGSARRAQEYSGAVVRTDSVAGHIEDLIQAGFVKLLE